MYSVVKEPFDRDMPSGKSLAILNVIPTLGVGGAERWLTTLGPALQKRGHEFHVAALWAPYDLGQELEAAGIHVFRLDVPHRRLFPIAIAKLRAVMHRNQYDIVNGHLLFGSLYARFAAALARGPARVVSTMYNLGYDSYPAKSTYRRLGKYLDGWSARRLDDLGICVSHGVEAHYRKHLRLTKTFVLPLGISPETVIGKSTRDRDELRRSLGIGNSFVIVNPARFVPEKGHRYLLEALRILKTVHGLTPKVLAIGGGSLRPVIEEAARERGLVDQVTFLPALPQQHLLEYMRAADLMVLPSTHDGCPTVVLEAMALGIPVVATAVGGIVDQVDPGVSGLLVPPADAESLADALHRIMNNQELREQLAHTAKQHVERFYVAELAQGYEALCMQLLTKGRAGTPSATSVPEIDT